MVKKYKREQLKKEAQGTLKEDFCFIVCGVGDNPRKKPESYEAFIRSSEFFDSTIKYYSEEKRYFPKRGYRNVNMKLINELCLDLSYLNDGRDEECRHLRRGWDFVLEDMDRVLLKKSL